MPRPRRDRARRRGPGRWLGPKDGALGMRLVFHKTGPRALPSSRGQHGEHSCLWTHRWALTRHRICWASVSASQPPELWQRSFCCFHATPSVVFCDNSPQKFAKCISRQKDGVHPTAKPEALQEQQCLHMKWWWVSRSVVSNSLRPCGLQPARLLCPWDSPGKNTGVGCHALLQGIFPTQGSNLGLLQCRQILYCLSQQSRPPT